jgi:hypothetical protein
MQAARAAEYRSLTEKAQTDLGSVDWQRRVQRRLRAELRRIERRDFFPPPEREEARAAVAALSADATLRR